MRETAERGDSALNLRAISRLLFHKASLALGNP